MNYYFPFGQKLEAVRQKDKSPKEAFILGVYASAVHAKWSDINGKQKVNALAVASEPDIFWNGENAEKIISSIKIPEELGFLEVPTNSDLNGPSGRALDKLFLQPLNLERQTSWLCDLLPESRVNPSQRAAIEKNYRGYIEKFNLPTPSIPDFDKRELNSESRRHEILEELEQSKAETLILLGDLPIYWFLRFFCKNLSKLAHFGDTFESYGKEHKIKIKSKTYRVIPLCHPRQAARLGNSNFKWGELHDSWRMNKLKANKIGITK